jgi:hypothetical protein
VSGGFLARVAARAVGQAAVASPRLPARFEERGFAAAEGLETIGLEVAAPPPAARRADARATEPLARRVLPAAAKVVSERVPAAEPTRAAKPRHDVQPAQHKDRAVTATALPKPLASPPSPVAEARLAHERPAPPPRAPSPSAVVREETPPVRVHIGRLEVRASLPEPAAQPPRRETPRTPGLSLSDYLRGERAAR